MDKKVAPIKPSDVAKQKQASFPNEVLEAFNQLIAEKFNNGYATIRQDDVVAILVAKGLNRPEIFKKGWLDVEGIYRKAGWKVAYDKPAYNESYPATFTFSKRS
ncbi:MAG: hypothetical protein WCV92_00700 [Candidatus Buchananbacteria bacterium]